MATLRPVVLPLVVLMLTLMLFVSAGCSSYKLVRPWQRERLSHPAMRLDARLGDAYHPHLYSITQGSVGGEVGGGGGCGCN